MNINKFLFVSVASIALIACQPKHPKAPTSADNGTYQCIAATITVAGKPMAALVEWNTQTGVARLLDSAVFTSKTAGTQSSLIGWVPLGELNQVIQEVLLREQQQQQKAASSVTPSLSDSAAMPVSTSSVETHAVKSKK